MSESRIPGGKGALLFFYTPLIVIFIFASFYFGVRYHQTDQQYRMLVQQDEIRQQEIRNLKTQNDQLQSKLSEIGSMIEQKESQLRQKEAHLVATQSVADQKETAEKIFSQKKELIALEQQKKLTEKLKPSLESKQVSLKRDQMKLILTIPNTELFETGSDSLKTTANSLIQQIAVYLQELPSEVEARVLSHHDKTPLQGSLAQKYPTLLDLTTARAQIVSKSLILQSKLSPQRILAAGMGDRQLLPTTEETAGKNPSFSSRRVEIIFDLAPSFNEKTAK